MDKSPPQDITIIPYTTFQKPISSSFLGLATTLRHIVPIKENHLQSAAPTTSGTIPLFLNSPLPSPEFKAIDHQKEDTDIDEEGIFALTELNNHDVTIVSSLQDTATSTSIAVEKHTIPLVIPSTAIDNGLVALLARSGSAAPYAREGNVMTGLDLGNHHTHHLYHYHHPPADDHRRPHKRSSPEDNDSDNDDGDSGRANTALVQATHSGRLSGSRGHYKPKSKPNQHKRQRRDDTNDVAATTAALTTSSLNPSTSSRETSVGSVLVPEEGSTQAPGDADTAVQEQQSKHRFPSLPPIMSIAGNQGSRENSLGPRIAAARAARGRSQLEDGEIDSVYGGTPANEIRDVVAYPAASTRRSGTTSSNGLEEGEIRSYVGAHTDCAASADISKHDLPMLTTTATEKMYETDEFEHGDTPWSAGSIENGEREMSQDLASLSLEATTEVVIPPPQKQKWALQQADAGRRNDDTHTVIKTSPQRRTETEHDRESAERKRQSTIRSPTHLPQVEVVISIPPPRAGLRRSSTDTTTSTHTITTNTPRGPRPLAASSITALSTTGDSSHNDVDMNADSNGNDREEMSSDDTLGIRFLKDKGKGKEVAAQPRQSSPVGSVVSIDDSNTDDDAFVVKKSKGNARQARTIHSPDFDISDDDHHMEQVDHQPEEMGPKGERKWLDFIRDSSDEDTSQAVDDGKTVVQKNDKDNTRRAGKQRTKDIRQQSPRRRPEGARRGGRTADPVRTHVASAKRSTVGNSNARAGPSRAHHRVAQSVSSGTTRSGNGPTRAPPNRYWDELVMQWKETLDICYEENEYADESPPSFGNPQYYTIKEVLKSIEQMKDQMPIDYLGQPFGIALMLNKMRKNLAVEYTIREQAKELREFFIERWRLEAANET